MADRLPGRKVSKPRFGLGAGVLGLHQVLLGGREKQQPDRRQGRQQGQCRLRPLPPRGQAKDMETNDTAHHKKRKRMRVPKPTRQQRNPQATPQCRALALSIQHHPKDQRQGKREREIEHPH